VQRLNLLRPQFEQDSDDPPRFRSSVWRLGRLVGARATGTSLYEIPPGTALCPYHYEVAEEEWLLVLDGRPTLRTPDTTERLEPMDIAFFARGPAGAHQVVNESDQPCAS
jgi:uncharacterized cupin superfamily protein